MKKELLKIALRQNAVVIHDNINLAQEKINATTAVLIANCNSLGYTFSEDLLKAINNISPKEKLEILDYLKEVSGVNKNWTPLVKQWNVPTGESLFNHVMTFIANALNSKKGTTMPCGHLIPRGSFPIERYNGCPYCGAPFSFEELEYTAAKNKLKVLQLWTETDLLNYLKDLLQSPTALDAIQVDDLKILLDNYKVAADTEVKMKETLMIVINTLVELGKDNEAGKYFKAPSDILRFLWYKHTGFLQLVEPKTIINRVMKNNTNLHRSMNNGGESKVKAETELKLKYSRRECRRYAQWINCLEMSIGNQCESMHPKRNMWVRVIRALRLSEYAKRPGFEKLAALLDAFYNETYEVWQGRVEHFKLKSDAEGTFKFLKQRPGLFARSLFSSMLWFGPDETLDHFREVIDKVPARLIFTLNMYADIYFVQGASRTIKALGGTNVKIPGNKLLQLYPDRDLKSMKMMVQELSLDRIKKKFSSVKNTNESIYIDKQLYNIPIAIGYRNEQLQDMSTALMGTRFPVEGDTVRLFLNWGEGLPAQHLDMDLSCMVAYDNKSEFCSYSNLTIEGCKHSGDIQRIPHKVGTAEYIDIDINRLQKLNARYVSFTCNAYTNGSLSPNLVVGWMNSHYPMHVTKRGVAYDPSSVQQQVRITQTLTKGMVFGVLDVANREIIWLEMSFGGQVVQNMSTQMVESVINKLDAKLKIGDLLDLKAETHELTLVSEKELADEVYDLDWARNTAQVSQLFLG